LLLKAGKYTGAVLELLPLLIFYGGYVDHPGGLKPIIIIMMIMRLSSPSLDSLVKCHMTWMMG